MSLVKKEGGGGRGGAGRRYPIRGLVHATFGRRPATHMFLRFFDQRKQIQALRQDMDDLQRAMKGLDLEWSEMYERLRSLLAKLAKRDLRAAANGDDVREDAPGGAVESPGDLGLTASQMTHQNRILARRHRMQVPPKGE